MKKFKKVLTGAIAAVALIATVGTTTSFAVTDAVPPVDETNNQVPGTYMYFEWGEGYAKTTNITTNYRHCYAEVTAYSNLTGKQVDQATAQEDCYHNEYAQAKVSSEYRNSNYNYKCSGHIRGGTSTNSAIIERQSDKLYPIPN